MALKKTVNGSNLVTDETYLFPKGKCSSEYPEDSYKKIHEGEAPLLDMEQFPYLKGGYCGEKE